MSGAGVTSGECAIGEICGDERRVRRGRVCNWALLEVLSQRSGDAIACVDSDSVRWTRDEGRLF